MTSSPNPAWRGVAKRTRRRRRGRASAGILLLLAIAVTFAGLGSGALPSRPAEAQSGVQPGAALAPVETIALVTVNVDPDSAQWGHASDLFGRLGRTVGAELGHEGFGWFDRTFRLDWERDLAAAAGSHPSVGVLDVGQRRFFALLDTNDPAAAWDAVGAGFEATARGEDDAATYSGALDGLDILLYQQDGENRVIAAMLGETVMLATGFDVASRLIAVSRGEAESLADRLEYQALAAAASGDFLVFAYVDGLPMLNATLPNQPIFDALAALGDRWHRLGLGDPPGFTLESGTIAARGVIEAALGRPMTIHVAAGERGLVVRQHLPGGGAAVGPAELLGSDRVPGETLAYVAGHDLAGWLYQPVVDAMERALLGQGDTGVATALAGAEAALGFDPELHAVALADRRFAGVLIIDPDEPAAGAVRLFLAVNDPVHARGTLAELDRLARAHGRDVETRTVLGNRTVVIRGLGPVTVMHELAGDEIRIEIGPNIPGAAARAGAPTLNDDPTFQSVIALLPPAPAGLAYLDVRRLVDVLAATGRLPPAQERVSRDGHAVAAVGLALERRADGIDEVVIVVVPAPAAAGR